MIKTKSQILKYLEDKQEDEIFEIKKKHPKSLRSIAQNKYYFGVIIKEISNFHWYTPIETHELVKQTLWIKTTTDLEKDEFKFMIDMIRDLWKNTYNVYIPAPNEIEELKSLEQYLF